MPVSVWQSESSPRSPILPGQLRQVLSLFVECWRWSCGAIRRGVKPRSPYRSTGTLRLNHCRQHSANLKGQVLSNHGVWLSGRSLAKYLTGYRRGGCSPRQRPYRHRDLRELLNRVKDSVNCGLRHANTTTRTTPETGWSSRFGPVTRRQATSTPFEG